MNHGNQKERRKDTIYLPLIFFFVTILTRIPFKSELLYHMDSVQFALALERYDITTHQPHPPGYFLYVMLGRLLKLFISDANSIFVSISVFFSGLTVVAIYYLGREMFDKKTGIISALIAITSPNLWFHGEVALSYIVEAFFSTFIAFLCWKIYKGEHKYLLLSAIALGIAGGIRQNSIVFLLPLWVFCVKGLPVRKIIVSFLLLGVVCLSWFIPMIQMTGGYDVYKEAFRELWLFNTGNVSVFDRGWASFKIFSSELLRFTIYGLGAGIFILSLTAYFIVRHGRLINLDLSKALFFALWILPSVMFYLLIFIHPANPGYALVFLPPLLILTAVSVDYIAEELRQLVSNDIFVKIACILIAINTASFFFTNYPVTYKEIKKHDRDLSIILDAIKIFDPSTTAIFVEPYVFYGYRQIMYYLPEYRVYQVDVRTAPTGEIRKTFWGENRKTFLADEIVLPENIKSFVAVVISDDKDKITGIKGISIKKLSETEIYIAFGHTSLIKKIYPELRIKL